MGKSICKGCNTKLPTEETLVIKGKKYCPTCSEQVRKGTEEVKVGKEKNKVVKIICKECKKEFTIDQVQKDKGAYRCSPCHEKWRKDVDMLKKLMDYIYEQQGKNKNKIVLAGKLVQDYVKEHGFSYNGILLTLKYFVEEKNGDISNGIGIVPYIYEEAREYFTKRREILEQIEEIKEPLVSYKAIKFKAESHKPKTNLPDIKVEEIQV